VATTSGLSVVNALCRLPGGGRVYPLPNTPSGDPPTLGSSLSLCLCRSRILWPFWPSLFFLSFVFFLSFFLISFAFFFFKLGISYLHFKCYSLSQFPVCKSPNHSPSPSSLRVFPSPPIPSYQRHPPRSPTLGVQPWQDQGLLLPLVPNKAILCYICSWSHESVHVYSLGSGLVPGNSGWLALLFLWGCKSLQLFQSFL